MNVKNSLNHDEKLFSLNEENNKSKSAKNVEIKKETLEVRPNSEIKTELATTMPTHNFIENSLVILTKQTLDIFLRQENPSELIALYTFYYYTAKWQQTNRPKCTTGYVAKALHWGIKKTQKIKKQLLEFGLIEDAKAVDPLTKRVLGHYIKINYIFKKETLEKNQKCANYSTQSFYAQMEGQNPSILAKDSTQSFFHPVEKRVTNALSTNNKNALSTDNLSKKVSKQLEQNKISPKKEKNNSVSISKKQTKAKKAKPKPISFDEIIDAYTENEDLRKELKEHLKTRKQKKAALTNRAIELSLKELDRIADSDEEKLRIVQKSIVNGWIGFFELNDKDKNKLKNHSSYNLNEYEKTMDTFENKSGDDDVILTEKEREEEFRKDLLFEGYKEIAPGVFQSDFYQNIEFLNEESRIAYEKNGGNSS